MNVCLVSYEYPPETFDGIGTYTRNLAHALVKLGEEVDVITFTEREPHQYLDEGVTVHRINAHEIKGLWRFDKVLPRRILAYSIAVSNKINDLLKSKKIQIIEGPEVKAELFYYLFTRKNNAIPVVIKLHTPSYLVQKHNFERIQFRERVLNFLEKQSVIKADYITSPSEHLRKTVANDYRIMPERISVVPHPVDAQAFSVAESLNSDGKIRVLFAGRIEKIKGVETLVRAIPLVLKRIPECTFTFIGNDTNSGTNRGSLRDELKEYLKQHNCIDKTNFYDRVEKEELIPYFQQSDITVVPSFYESLGFVCLEAMACGKAVIASAAGGLQEIVRDNENGFLVPPGNHEILAQKIIALCENSGLRAELGNKARKHIDTYYSAPAAGKNTLNYYLQIFKGHRR